TPSGPMESSPALVNVPLNEPSTCTAPASSRVPSKCASRATTVVAFESRFPNIGGSPFSNHGTWGRDLYPRVRHSSHRARTAAHRGPLARPIAFQAREGGLADRVQVARVGGLVVAGKAVHEELAAAGPGELGHAVADSFERPVRSACRMCQHQRRLGGAGICG